MKLLTFPILLANGTETLLWDMFQIDVLYHVNFRSNTCYVQG